MSVLLRLKIAKALSAAIFWLPVVIIYFRYLGFDGPDAYAIVAFYGICVALLEFPTGVISDYYSQSFSLKLGYLVIAVTLLLLSFPQTVASVYVLQFLSALGMALSSGSDVAVLTQYSHDKKKDVKEMKVWFHLSMVLAMPIGSLLYAIKPELPIFLTALATFGSFFLVYRIQDIPFKNKVKRLSGNVFAKAWEGVQIVRKSKTLLLVTLVSSLLVGFELTFKFVFNDLFLSLKLPEAYHGIAISLLLVLQTVGISQFKSVHSRRNTYSFALLPILVLALAFSRNLIVTVIILSMLYLFRGVNDTFLELLVIEETPQENTASVLSLKSLLQRIASAGYTYSLGQILVSGSIFSALGVMGGVLVVITLWFLIGYRKERQKYAITTDGR